MVLVKRTSAVELFRELLKIFRLNSDSLFSFQFTFLSASLSKPHPFLLLEPPGGVHYFSPTTSYVLYSHIFCWFSVSYRTLVMIQLNFLHELFDHFSHRFPFHLILRIVNTIMFYLPKVPTLWNYCLISISTFRIRERCTSRYPHSHSVLAVLSFWIRKIHFCWKQPCPEKNCVKWISLWLISNWSLVMQHMSSLLLWILLAFPASEPE